MYNARGRQPSIIISGWTVLTEMQGMIELIKKDSEKGFGDLF